MKGRVGVHREAMLGGGHWKGMNGKALKKTLAQMPENSKKLFLGA